MGKGFTSSKIRHKRGRRGRNQFLSQLSSVVSKVLPKESKILQKSKIKRQPDFIMHDESGLKEEHDKENK